MAARLPDIPGAPHDVQRHQQAWRAVSRVAILKILISEGEQDRHDLAEALGITVPSTQKALTELIELGYVTYRVPPHTRASYDQPSGTLYSARKVAVIKDLAATILWLSE